MEDIFEELADEVSDHDNDIEEAIEVNDRSSGNQNGDGGEARIVQPKRIVSRPRLKLDVPRLIGPRGIPAIKSSFEGVKFKGKGHELDDLNTVLFRLQHWTYRLFPKITFEDCVNRVEELGNKKPVMVTMHKLRMGIEETPIDDTQVDDIVEDVPERTSYDAQVDAIFDRLVEQQPQPPQQQTTATVSTLTEEQRARMMRNRLIAEERRMARLEAMRMAKEAEEQGSLIDGASSAAGDAEPSTSVNRLVEDEPSASRSPNTSPHADIFAPSKENDDISLDA